MINKYYNDLNLKTVNVLFVNYFYIIICVSVKNKFKSWFNQISLTCAYQQMRCVKTSDVNDANSNWFLCLYNAPNYEYVNMYIIMRIFK